LWFVVCGLSFQEILHRLSGKIQNNLKRILMLIVLLFAAFQTPVLAQQDTVKEYLGLVKWMTLPEAEALNAKHPKPIMIDVYTDWCGWCKHMMKTTFSEPGIAQYINLNFYPVRFNAEMKDTIVFQGKKYGNRNMGARSVNDLAINLIGEKLSYPTTVFFANNFQFKLLVPGYLAVRDIEPILVYTAEYVFNTTSVEDFRKYYNISSTPDTNHIKDTIRWTNFPDKLDNGPLLPKKFLIFLNTNWCNSGRVMAKGSFRDSTVVHYMNEHFTPLYLNAEYKDTISFRGKKYANDGTYGNFHSLAVNLCSGKLVLPSMIIMDSNLDVISSIPQFYPPADLNIILHFFAEDAYKTMKWEDYRKGFK
jgi:thioredoxin-related protein